MKNDVCPLCGTNSINTLYSVFGHELMKTFALRKCETCKVCYTSPFVSDEEMQRLYTDTYYKKDSSRLKYLLEDFVPLPRFQRRKNVEKFMSGGKILDIGCGNGAFLNSFNREKWEVHGAELSEESASPAMGKSIKVHVGDIRKLDLPEEYFDVITMWHVFEHIRDPKGLLKKIFRLLKKDGIMIIAVPNIGSVQAGIFSKNWYHLDVPRHLFHYSSASLKKLLNDNLFTIIQENHLVLKNFYGFSQSFFNAAGFEQNLIRNTLLGKKSKSRRARILLNMLLLPVVVPVAIIFCLAESLMGKGGTFEVYCLKNQPS